MGRHSAAPEPPPPATPDPGPSAAAPPAPSGSRVVTRLVLALVSAATVAAVTLWGGTPWPQALLLAGAAAVAVGVGAWLASTLPGRPEPPTSSPASADAPGPRGGEPVQ